MIKDSFAEVFSGKKKIMFVYAHPDDAEMYSGGTIARLKQEDFEVRHVKMTMGNKGSRQENYSEEGLAKIRETEDEVGLEVLGLTPKDSVNLDLGDGEVANDLPTIGKLVREIRSFRPDIIVTHNPEKVIVRDDVTEFLFVDSWGDPDLVQFDVTEFYDQKIKAIGSHKSQYGEEKAQGAADYFAPEKDGRRYEQFRYVKAD